MRKRSLKHTQRAPGGGGGEGEAGGANAVLGPGVVGGDLPADRPHRRAAGKASAGAGGRSGDGPPPPGAVCSVTRLYNPRMASDIFAKIGDIKGESLDAKHKDEIEVLSFSWGVTNAGGHAGGGGGAGKATFQDLSIVHNIDKASPKLLEACATGTHLKEATITHRKAGKGQQEFLIVKMNDIIITGVTHGGTSWATGVGDRDSGVCQGRLRIQTAKARWVARCGIHFKYDLKANKVG